METTLRTFSVLVDDEPGVLSQISRLFSRKGFNIESLAVGPTEEHGLSRLTLEVLTDDQQTELCATSCPKWCRYIPSGCWRRSTPSAGRWCSARSGRRSGASAAS